MYIVYITEKNTYPANIKYLFSFYKKKKKRKKNNLLLTFHMAEITIKMENDERKL